MTSRTSSAARAASLGRTRDTSASKSSGERIGGDAETDSSTAAARASATRASTLGYGLWLSARRAVGGSPAVTDFTVVGTACNTNSRRPVRIAAACSPSVRSTRTATPPFSATSAG